MQLLFIGDIVGRPGRRIVAERLDRLIDQHRVDFVVANCENAAAGFGMTADIADQLFDLGVDVLTSGNHIWDKKEIYPRLEKDAHLLRPANYPGDLPGHGYGLYETAAGIKVGVINLEGRVFMNNLECPFRTADQMVENLRQETPVIFVDFHAEVTSEKQALGLYLDGRVSALVGTHTHVQTADETVLSQGTAYLTDAGMTGARDAVIGMRAEGAIERFLTQLPARLEVAKNDPALCGALIDIDEETGRARSINRVLETLDS